MQYDVITIGSATRDVFLKDGFKAKGGKLCFDLGSKNEVSDIHFATGGGGTNSAATFANLGFKVACVSRIGNDRGGKAVLDDLKDLNIDSEFVREVDGSQTAYSVIISTDEGRVVLVHRGASQEFEAADIPLEKLKAKWFYISSLAGNLELLKNIFDYAVEKDIRIAWNPGSKELKSGLTDLKPLLSKVGVLLVNLEEAQLLTGKEKSKEIFEKLIESTNGIIVVTNGMKGVNVCSNKTCFSAPSLGDPAIERTGAGDSFGSGFVSGLIDNNDIEYATQLASANANSVVQEIGAKNGLLRKNMLDSFEKVKVEDFNL